MPSSQLERARIVASFGRQFYVRTLDAPGPDRVAVTRGKRTDFCVGDEVTIGLIGADQAVIESGLRRRSELIRSDRYNVKRLAANVDQAAIVIAADPRFSEELLLRMLLACAHADIPALILANKLDLTSAWAAIAPRLQVYRDLGYQVIELAVRDHPQETRATLAPVLSGHNTILMGESGMGKSTLVNTLVPGAALATREISEALCAGRHTTTFSKWFDLPPESATSGAIVDTPGFQTFGLAHVSESQRVHAMPEYAELIGQCRFHNCSHVQEPGCAIRAALESGAIDPIRYLLFSRLSGRD
jgi:ribosome biogenesis GTPase